MAFSIPCQSCDRAFSLDDDLFERRVAGKLVRFKCPECGEASSINALEPNSLKTIDKAEAPERALGDDDLVAGDAEISELSDDEVASLPPEEVAQLQRRPPPRPRLESKIDDELWVVSVREGAEDQEVFESSLVHLIATGKMPPDAIVWREGMTEWLALADVPELAKHLPPPDDKTGGFLGTGMHASFGSNPERKSTPPPLPPKKRSYGSGKKRSHGQKGSDGTKPVALSPGLLFSVDDAESEPPHDLEAESHKGPRAVPKPPLKAPKRAVTRDLDFSDIADDEEGVPLSGTPALKDLTTHPGKDATAGGKPADSSRQLFAGLGGGPDEQVLGPPSIDISDLASPPKTRPEPPRDSDAPPSAPAVGKSSSASPRSTKPKSQRPKTRSSKRPAEARASRRSSQSESTRPSRRPKAADGRAEPPPEEQSRGWLTPGRLLVLFAIAGFAYFLFSRQMQSRAPSEAAVEPPVQAQTAERGPPATEHPRPEPAEPSEATAPVLDAAEPEAAPRTPAPAASPPARDKQPGAPAPAVAAPAAAAPAAETKPAAGGQEKSAEPPSAEPKTGASVAAPKPAVDAPPFDKAAAVSALNTVVAQASGCRQEGDPTGTARVVVTFAPSGRVTTANLSGPPFAGTRTGGCIAATMRRATVPPFSGSHVTVAKSVVIR